MPANVIDAVIDARPKVLLAITGAFGLGGGIARANRLVIHSLIDAGCAIDLYALNETPAANEQYARFPNLRYIAFSGSKIRFASAIWRALLRQRYRLTFCDHINLASMLFIHGKLHLTRLVVMLYGIEVFPPKPTLEGRLGLFAAAQRIAISSFTQAKTHQQFPALAIQVCDLSLDPDQSQRLGALPDAAPPPAITLAALDGTAHELGEHVILLVGRMASDERYKGHDTLIASLPHVLPQFPDAQLVLVGHGDDAPRLRDLAASTSAQAAIFMPGYVSDQQLEQLYRQAYVFAMPSRGEGFGLVYLEAMACAKPCIGSRVDAAQSVIRHEQTGLLVTDPSDPREVASAILRLFSDPASAHAMGAAGFELVKSQYLFPHFKARFLPLLNLGSG